MLKSEDGQHVDVPAHLLAFVDSRDAVDADLDRTQHRMKEGTLAGEDPIHVGTDRLGGQQQEHAIERPLSDCVAGQPGRHG